MKKNEILVVALGPDDGSFLTLGACDAIRNARRVVLRTARHEALKLSLFREIEYESLDAFYDANEDFDSLCQSIATYLISQADDGDLCYVVPDPVSDATVRVLLEQAPDTVRVRLMGGVTMAGNALAAVAPYGHSERPEHYHVYSAMSLDKRRVQMEPQLICEINDRVLASDVKLWLLDLYEDDTELLFIRNAGSVQPEVRQIFLYDLDRQPEYDHRTTIFVPETDVLTRSRASYEDFVKIIAYLRSPDGCPWDRAQTHKTLRRYMIEEACEAADAMGTDDNDKIADELGDVLLQVVLNAQVGAEHRTFTDRDVTSAITRKMISRHEHVFGTAKAETPEATTAVWEQAKIREHGEQSVYERVMDLPNSLPVLLRAQKMIKRELTAAGQKPDSERAKNRIMEVLSNQTAVNEEQIGICLEALCEMAEANGLDSESALREQLHNKAERLRVCDNRSLD